MGLALVTLIGDNMKRVVFILGLFAFTCILVNNNLLARQKQIQIIGQLSAESGQAFVLTQKMMEANATTYTSQDPNFPDDGKKEFKGILMSLKCLLQKLLMNSWRNLKDSSEFLKFYVLLNSMLWASICPTIAYSGLGLWFPLEFDTMGIDFLSN